MSRREKIASARDFLWRHWSDKKCAELFVVSWSREGVRGDSHYSIQIANSNAVLRVTSSTRDDPSAPVVGLAVPSSGPVKQDVSDTRSYEAYAIERIEIEVPFDVQKAKVIPEGRLVPPSRYHLRFKDKQGRVITDF